MNGVVESFVLPDADIGRRVIPFDHTLAFELRGQVDQTLSETIRVSVEAPFVVHGIGYGFTFPVDTLEFGPLPGQPGDDEAPEPPPLGVAAPPPLRLTLFERTLQSLARRLQGQDAAALEGVLRNGFRLNPKYLPLLRDGGRAGPVLQDVLRRAPGDLFQVAVPPPDRLQFLYAIRDEGTGRTFQNEPVLSTAGLGSPDGRRPFRQLATPITFAPRTTIRVDVTPLTRLSATLHLALHGFKVLGSPGSPTDARRALRRGRRRA